MTGTHFDWRPKPRVTIAYKNGDVGFGTRTLIERGLSIGVIEVLSVAPDGYRVDKAGKVIRDA